MSSILSPQPNSQMHSVNVHDLGRHDEDHDNIVTGTHNKHNRQPRRNMFSNIFKSNSASGRRKRLIYLTCAVVLILIVILSVVLTGKNKSKSSTSENLDGLSTNGPRYPEPEVEPPVHQTNKNDLGSVIVDFYENTLGINNWNDILSDTDSPQYHALQWIAGRDEYVTYTGVQRIQRYALATFYYSTFLKSHDFLSTPTDWVSQNKWLSDDEECTWEGISCNEENLVIAIRLPKNALSGSLPVELALLTQLIEIDFTTNYIYMEDELNMVWEHMTNLQVIMMEDNYVVTSDGLPSEFGAMNNLLKIQLSYNLLQGKLPGDLFTNLQKLEHLELESNYLSGDIPIEVGQLPNLVYVYLRRNLLTINITSMLGGDGNTVYPSLFSLWLDNNEAIGTLPSQMGQLTGLASFSITNSSLAGSIPDEFGSLTDLRRVWLYSNDMTGTIPTTLSNLNLLEVFEFHDNQITGGTVPDSICNSIASSDYGFKALTADCNLVTCTCCTVCYEG